MLFVHNGRTRFVNTDFYILSKHYVVTEYYLRSRRVNPWKTFSLIKSHDFVFGWFASWHTFFPMLFSRLLGKPSALVIGGYDLANMPEIGYGHQRGGFKKWISRWSIYLASYLISFSYYSQNEAEENVGIAKERVQVIYLGVPDPFGSLPHVAKEQMVLSVGNVDRANLWRKGHEPFVRAATYLPDFQFVLVGRWRDKTIEHLQAIAPPNVTFTGWISDEDLRNYYLHSSVYVQASLHEGFGMSVAEAMLASCIPVVTRTGALPEVVGETGVYIGSQDPSLLANAIRQAHHLGKDKSFRCEVRTRILELFSLEKRERKLCSLIDTSLEQRV